ncbi:MAG: redoxin domain-containing protein [Candidatus Thermoplasmatota archaeon]|nr:redoxin domain-containing protein [Candidatus Thermoplasmatota archaeon]
MIKIGSVIPDLEAEALVEYEFRKVRFSEYRGKWLAIAFYPADFTFVCPTELEELAIMQPKFDEIGAQILSVSTDTHFTHFAWHESSPAIGKVRYPMLADPTRRISEAFGTLIEEEGLSLRATFIVDPEGVLRSMHIHDNSIGRSAREILRQVQAAKHVREHPGEVCPASWEPGEETLSPGPSLIGKI